MGIFSNAFERRWFLIFAALFFLIMVPFPWYYSEQYIPGPMGLPLFLYGWVIHGIVTLILVAVFAKQCLKRKEYQAFDQEQSKTDESHGKGARYE